MGELKGPDRSQAWTEALERRRGSSSIIGGQKIYVNAFGLEVLMMGKRRLL